jgi:hypothetical protein
MVQKPCEVEKAVAMVVMKQARNDAEADGHSLSLPMVVPGASVLRITGSRIVAGTDQNKKKKIHVNA